MDIVAANSADGFLGNPGEPYLTLSGTSMATPHVAGAAALLAQQHPDWTPAQLKSALTGSADPADGPTTFDQGAGRVDVAAAITTELLAEPSSLSLGRPQWPHHDDEPVNKELVVSNTGGADTTLALRLEVTGPGNIPAPAGMFTISATELTVPAGGQASVRVTADTRVAGPDGHYTGRLVGTAGDTRLQVPLAIDREVESYNLTIEHITRDGQPAGPDTFAESIVAGVDNGIFTFAGHPSGTATVRVPRGRYLPASLIETLEPEIVSSMLVRPALELIADTTVTADARQGRPMRVSVPNDSAALAIALVEFVRATTAGGFGVGVILSGSLDNFYTAQLGAAVPPDQLTATIATQWARPDGSDWFNSSPYLYATLSTQQGRFFTGFTRQFRPRDFATVLAKHGAQAPGRTADRVVFGVSTNTLLGIGVGLNYPLPSQRTEYLSADGVRWGAVFLQLDGDGQPEAQLGIDPLHELRAGRRYVQQWNRAVFGPSFPETAFPQEWITRLGDEIMVFASLFGDDADRYGFSLVDSGRTTLFRNGVKVAETAQPGFGRSTVPPGPADYRLEVEATRSGISELTSRLGVAWTFQSAHVDGDTPVRLPVSAVRFTPRLDDADSAPGGHPFLVPVSVQRQVGAPPSDVRELSVEASYDDGATWRPVRLVGPDSAEAAGLDRAKLGDARWIAVLHHPRGPGFVSLRATATDRDRNTVQQTIIRAYRLR